MNQKERFIIVGLLGLIAFLVVCDLVTDSKEGVVLWHVVTEGLMGLVALMGILYLLRGTMTLRHRLQNEMEAFTAYKCEADAWRVESKKYIEGLSKAIDEQLTKWNLTAAEKEVAFLLLKGLSLKEVAEVRGTTEKTSRVQSMAIYAKAGLSGRSELSAFFLEDLLVPLRTSSNQRKKMEEFLAELAAPVGPGVFAGGGSEFQKLRVQWEKEDPLAVDKEEEFIKNWVEKQDLLPTLDALFDIARNPPGLELYNGIATRRKFEWDYHLADLIYQFGLKDRAALLSRLQEELSNEKNPPALTMVKGYLKDES